MTDDDGDVLHLFTATEAQQFFKIPAATVRSWFRRRRIYHFGIDRRGNPMFDRRDLIRLRDRSMTRDQHEQARRAADRCRSRGRIRGARNEQCSDVHRPECRASEVPPPCR